MAGKRRRHRCNQCKGMFHVQDNDVVHRLKSVLKTFRQNNIFCSDKCLRDYVLSSAIKDLKQKELSNGDQITIRCTLYLDGFGTVSLTDYEIIDHKKDSDIRIGDTIKFLTGPYRGELAIVTSIDPQKKKHSVQLLHKSVKVEGIEYPIRLSSDTLTYDDQNTFQKVDMPLGLKE